MCPIAKIAWLLIWLCHEHSCLIKIFQIVYNDYEISIIIDSFLQLLLTVTDGIEINDGDFGRTQEYLRMMDLRLA